MDTNVNEEVDMDLLVKDNPDPIDDYKEEVNKEVEEQNPDPDQVVKADLEMDPAAATEAFIRKRFGLSSEDLEEQAAVQEEAGEELVENATAEPVADEDDIFGVEEPVATEETTVTVVPPAGGETVVTDDGGVDVPAADVGTDTEVAVTDDTAAVDEPISVEPETTAEVAALENLRALFSREDDDPTAADDAGVDGDQPDVSLNVETPNNNVDIDLEDKAVTIEPVDEDSEEPADDGNSDDVPSPETSDEDESTEEEESSEGPSEEGGESEGGEEETDNSAESWWLI